MFETFDDILNSHIHIPPTFSGIAICEVDYIITSINKTYENGKQYIRHQYDVSFEVIGAEVELSNTNYE